MAGDFPPDPIYGINDHSDRLYKNPLHNSLHIFQLPLVRNHANLVNPSLHLSIYPG